ncbi:MAG: hypothetical protein IPQ16_09655 [Geobacteraceae bacterium]|nr:hypothetical protein [Geobacteraceae bacterium]
MTIRTMICLIILTLFTAAIPAHSTDLPPAPNGCSWTRFDETKSAFLNLALFQAK